MGQAVFLHFASQVQIFTPRRQRFGLPSEAMKIVSGFVEPRRWGFRISPQHQSLSGSKPELNYQGDGMDIRRASLAAALLIVTMSFPGCAKKSNATREQEVVTQIYELERQSRDASIQRDAAFSERILSDDYLAIGPLGQFVTKADTVAARRQSQVKFDSIHISNLKIRVYGDTAIVTGRAEVRGSDLGEDFSGPYLYTRIWAKVNNEWKTVSYQATVSR